MWIVPNILFVEADAVFHGQDELGDHVSRLFADDGDAQNLIFSGVSQYLIMINIRISEPSGRVIELSKVKGALWGRRRRAKTL
jgi:hypothetical protein